MDSRDHLLLVVPKQDRNAVGCPHADADVGQLSAEGIHTIEGKGLLQRILAEESLVDDDGGGFMRLMQRHEQAGNVNSNTAISRGGEGGDVLWRVVYQHKWIIM